MLSFCVNFSPTVHVGDFLVHEMKSSGTLSNTHILMSNALLSASSQLVWFRDKTLVSVDHKYYEADGANMVRYFW